MGGTQDKRQRPGQPGKGPEETGQGHQAAGSSHRPQQPEKVSRSLKGETKRHRQEDMASEGDEP